MDTGYEHELESIGDSLVEMTNLVSSAMARATTALLDADMQLAESVITADETVDLLYREVEERAFALLARRPAGGGALRPGALNRLGEAAGDPALADLRVLITSLRMVADLERMGDLALHIAKVARRRYPASAVPPELRGTLLEMGQVAQRIVVKAGSVIAGKDLAMAAELERDDDVMDRLHRQVFTMLLAPDWSHGMEAAIDITLCGRYYERFADHAVSVARRVVYLVTGEYASGQ
ncbi:MAG: phosphate signaling complex PhoU family protein [Mycobacteriales bacterium]